MSQIPGYFTVEEAADRLGVSHSQVTRYIKNRLLKAKDLGRQYLIAIDEVKNFDRPPRGNPMFRRKTG